MFFFPHMCTQIHIYMYVHAVQCVGWNAIWKRSQLFQAWCFQQLCFSEESSGQNRVRESVMVCGLGGGCVLENEYWEEREGHWGSSENVRMACWWCVGGERGIEICTCEQDGLWWGEERKGWSMRGTVHCTFELDKTFTRWQLAPTAVNAYYESVFNEFGMCQ